MLHPLKSNIDTKNDGPWKMYLFFSNMASFWVAMLNFRGVIQYVFGLEISVGIVSLKNPERYGNSMENLP